LVEYLRASARRRLFDEESSLLAAAAGVGFGVGVYHRGGVLRENSLFSADGAAGEIQRGRLPT
jgi:hypothetical protein